jgi:hypothetical protein
MDEPLSNLDAQLRQDMRAELRQLQRQLGITMVYVTHDQVEAMSMADRVVLLNRGRIEQNATPVELYERPANTFVARFIGTPPMNLLPLEAGAGGAGGRRHRRPRRRAGRLAGLTSRAAGAHHARLRSRVHATVAGLEYLGADSLVTCRLGATSLAVRIPGASAWPAAMPRACRGLPVPNTSSSATACVAPMPSTFAPRRCSRRQVLGSPRGEDHVAENYPHRHGVHRGRGHARGRTARRGAGAGRSLVLLPGRRRRSDHEDHRHVRRGLREGKIPA